MNPKNKNRESINSIAHKLKRLVQVVRNDANATSQEQINDKIIAFDRLRSHVIEAYGIQCRLYNNDDVSVLVDRNDRPLAIIDLDQNGGHFLLIPTKGRENDPILRQLLHAIKDVATEIHHGADLH